jgi:hypothetical protein
LSIAKRIVHFFEEAGVENTDHVIEAVKQRIRQGDACARAIED